MDIREDLLQILTEYTDGRITSVNPDDVMTADLGLNSFELFDIVCAIEDEFGVSISDRDLMKMVTVGDLVSFIEKNA